VSAIARALGMQDRVVTRLPEAYKTMRDKVLPKIKGGRGLAARAMTGRK
jgi:hypothetical protein